MAVNFIFKKNWHLLDAKVISTVLYKSFQDAKQQPCEMVIGALQKQGIALIQILDHRTRSTTYRIWQTDEVFNCHINYTKCRAFSSSISYLWTTLDDVLVKRNYKKIPVFVGKRIDENTSLIKHNRMPNFKCLYQNGKLVESSFVSSNNEKITALYETKILVKSKAFYNSYFKALNT